MTPTRRAIYATVVSVFVHLCVATWLVADAEKDGAQSPIRAHHPVRIKVRLQESAGRKTPPPDLTETSYKPEVAAPPPIDRYIPQNRLTRKTELLTPIELDELFPNGAAPSRSITFILHVSAAGTVDEIILPKGTQATDLDGLATTLKRWVFLPGEIHRSAVPTVVEIEFSPAVGLELKPQP